MGFGGLLLWGRPGCRRLMWATDFQRQAYCPELGRKLFALGRPGMEVTPSLYTLWHCAFPRVFTTVTSPQNDPVKRTRNKSFISECQVVPSCRVELLLGEAGMVVPFTPARYTTPTPVPPSPGSLPSASHYRSQPVLTILLHI